LINKHRGACYPQLLIHSYLPTGPTQFVFSSSVGGICPVAPVGPTTPVIVTHHITALLIPTSSASN